ncbi:MAG TPA: hypothetical protein VFE62_24535 [Gemmataceae bacterium]|nr:hypothetical protein [Gemmataceae bacterium]
MKNALRFISWVLLLAPIHHAWTWNIDRIQTVSKSCVNCGPELAVAMNNFLVESVFAVGIGVALWVTLRLVACHDRSQFTPDIAHGLRVARRA